MPLEKFYNFLWKYKRNEHKGYTDSILSPIAPEYTTGEVLLGAAYRKLILGEREAVINLENINSLFSSSPTWDAILREPGGLTSPKLSRQDPLLRQLMPFVPEIARYACVLGRPRNRWDPGNLLLSTIGSGLGPEPVNSFIQKIRDALFVDENDDILARYVEESLKQLNREPSEGFPKIPDPKAPAWRRRRSSGYTPAECFTRDLGYTIKLKSRLTRRQWTVLVEAVLRIGLGTHALWLCRLNKEIWEMTLEATSNGTKLTEEVIESRGWNVHDGVDPLIELGLDAIPLIKKGVREYVQARMGLNIVLHALADADCEWQEGIGVPPQGSTQDPVGAVANFLSHVAENSEIIKRTLQEHLHDDCLKVIISKLADSNLRILSTKSGTSKNLFEFIRYSLGQLQTLDDEMKLYDQSYILFKKTGASNSPWLVKPAPTALILMTHACCQSLGAIPASMDDFQSYLAKYGINAPTGELQCGQTGRDLERLGLVVDSPDAGGGRLLVDPF